MIKAIVITLFLAFLCFDFISSQQTDQIYLRKIGISQIPDDIFIPGLGSLVIDSKGNMFAFAGKYEYNQNFIIKLDNNLKFIKKFGRHGKGPGEFTTTRSTEHGRINIDKNGFLYVNENHPFKVIKFNNNGKFLTEINIQRDYSKVYKGNFNLVNQTYYTSLKPNMKHFMDTKYFPPSGILASFPNSKIIVEYPFIEKRIIVTTGDITTVGLFDYCYGDNCFIESNNNLVLFGNSQIYKFKLFDLEGHLLLSINDKQKKMNSFKEEELEVIFKRKTILGTDIFEHYKQNRPQHYLKLKNLIKHRKNVIADIKLTTSKIYVFQVPELIQKNSPFPVTVYNLKGDIIKNCYLQSIPYLITEDFAYFITENSENGDPIIEKYKIEF
jgi:hypothetical protein